MMQVLALVREVGMLVVGERTRGLQVREKSPGDPVTHADELANAKLVGALRELFPDAGIVAEESPHQASEWHPDGVTLFVDPIDGTRDYVAGGADFSVMVGAVERGVPVWGVVYEPAKDSMAYAWQGRAFVRTKTGTQALVLVDGGELQESVVVVSRSRSGGRIGQFVDSLGAREVRRVGGMGTKLMQVATNQAQGFVQPVGGGYAWDSAAGEAILRAMGACITDALGAALSYREPDNRRLHGIVAAAPALHAELVDRTRTAAAQMSMDGYLPSWTPRAF